MVDAVRSDTPTAVVSANNTFETLQVQVTNPTPTGVRPAVTSNSIFRRQTGATGVWTLAGIVGNNGLFIDYFQRSSTQFDYFVRTDSYADSITYTGTVPTVSGMWAYSSVDNSTLMHFPYTDGGTESLDEFEAALQFVGRTYAVIESGIQENQTIGLNVTIPFSDLNWRDQVEWWRSRKRDRQTLLYRDGRGRVFAGRIVGAMGVSAARNGAVITGTFQRVDYVSSTTSLDPAYYQGGVYNDGGNGIYGNGTQGNGY